MDSICRDFEAFAQTLPPTNVQYWTLQQLLGSFYFRAGFYNKARTILLPAFEEIGKLVKSAQPKALNSRHERVLYKLAVVEYDAAESLCNEIAEAHYQSGNLQSAKALFEKCLTYRKTKLRDTHPDSLKTLTRLACVHRDLGDIERGLEILHDALEWLDAVVGKEHPLVFDAAYEIGKAYQLKALKYNPVYGSAGGVVKVKTPPYDSPMLSNNESRMDPDDNNEGNSSTSSLKGKASGSSSSSLAVSIPKTSRLLQGPPPGYRPPPSINSTPSHGSISAGGVIDLTTPTSAATSTTEMANGKRKRHAITEEIDGDDILVHPKQRQAPFGSMPVMVLDSPERPSAQQQPPRSNSNIVDLTATPSPARASASTNVNNNQPRAIFRPRTQRLDTPPRIRPRQTRLLSDDDLRIISEQQAHHNDTHAEGHQSHSDSDNNFVHDEVDDGEHQSEEEEDHDYASRGYYYDHDHEEGEGDDVFGHELDDGDEFDPFADGERDNVVEDSLFDCEEVAVIPRNTGRGGQRRGGGGFEVRGVGLGRQQEARRAGAGGNAGATEAMDDEALARLLQEEEYSVFQSANPVQNAQALADIMAGNNRASNSGRSTPSSRDPANNPRGRSAAYPHHTQNQPWPEDLLTGWRVAGSSSNNSRARNGNRRRGGGGGRLLGGWGDDEAGLDQLLLSRELQADPQLRATLMGMLAEEQGRGLAMNPANYLQDESFDDSYESLLALSERIGDAKPKGAKTDIIRSLPVKKFKKPTTSSTSHDGKGKGVDKNPQQSETDGDDARCAICLMDFEEGDELSGVPCLHWFHGPQTKPSTNKPRSSRQAKGKRISSVEDMDQMGRLAKYHQQCYKKVKDMTGTNGQKRPSPDAASDRPEPAKRPATQPSASSTQAQFSTSLASSAPANQNKATMQSNNNPQGTTASRPSPMVSADRRAYGSALSSASTSGTVRSSFALPPRPNDMRTNGAGSSNSSPHSVNQQAKSTPSRSQSLNERSPATGPRTASRSSSSFDMDAALEQIMAPRPSVTFPESAGGDRATGTPSAGVVSPPMNAAPGPHSGNVAKSQPAGVSSLSTPGSGQVRPPIPLPQRPGLTVTPAAPLRNEAAAPTSHHLRSNSESNANGNKTTSNPPVSETNTQRRNSQPSLQQQQNHTQSQSTAPRPSGENTSQLPPTVPTTTKNSTVPRPSAENTSQLPTTVPTTAKNNTPSNQNQSQNQSRAEETQQEQQPPVPSTTPAAVVVRKDADNVVETVLLNWIHIRLKKVWHFWLDRRNQSTPTKAKHENLARSLMKLFAVV
ncbi:hypothetical protein HDU76_005676, partial [Blyttiomyces sp. JEL0837]